MKRVHWNVLFDYIAEGRGQGHLEQYRALIRQQDGDWHEVRLRADGFGS